MATSSSTFDRFLDPVAACLTPHVAQRIVDLETDQKTLERLEILREKANFGSLSEDERAEYEEFVEGMDFVAILKAKAEAVLDRGESL